MDENNVYSLSLLGEFKNRKTEHEFLNSDIKFYSKFVGALAIVFGIIFMLYSLSDWYAIKSSSLLILNISIRSLFLFMSFMLYFITKKITSFNLLQHLIVAYQLCFFIFFLIVIYIYGPIGLTPFFSMMAITLAVYITPNRLIHSQIISVLFNVLFFLFYSHFVQTIDNVQLVKLIQYTLVFLIFGNIQAYLTNIYRRKRFANSRELLRLSVTDTLTGVYNRAKFDIELSSWVDVCLKDGHPLSLAIFDIDCFKNVNDNYGHMAGDSILLNVTSTIKSSIRNTDVFARWGGDEFVILLPNTDAKQAFEITERIRISIQNSKYNDIENVTCSFGLVSLQKGDNTESLLQRADKYLYRAKKMGKNTVVNETSDDMYSIIEIPEFT